MGPRVSVPLPVQMRINLTNQLVLQVIRISILEGEAVRTSNCSISIERGVSFLAVLANLI